MSNNYNSEKRNRHSIRLKNYDYSRTGIYFITICTNENEYLFGKIKDQQMILNDAGKILEKIWNEMQTYYITIKTDVFQIMPDHFHGIVIIRGKDAYENYYNNNDLPNLSLSDVVKNYKTLTTKLYTDGVKDGIFEPYNQRLWQHNFWDYIIRTDEELKQIRQYIINNPKKEHKKGIEEYDF